MENEFSNVLKTAMKFASALGKHEGNIKFILNEQHQLTKEDIIKYLQETYDEVNSILSQE
jgi:plasmid maintenance system antidote protein VapI